jgi:hypothetical protein
MNREAFLTPIRNVVERATNVRVHEDQIQAVADWMAYESLPWPDFRSPLVPDTPDAAESDTMDFLFLTSTINFAFTDFEEHRIFQTELSGRTYFDSDAMMACLRRAYDSKTPILEGEFLAGASRSDLAAIFAGNIEMPLLDERVRIFREIGSVLMDGFGGRFHNFAREHTPRAYAEPGGLLAALVEMFPSFRDDAEYRGARVVFHKRAQLLLWQLHARFRESGYFRLEDPESLTAFADYIVPVALRLLRITSYSPELEDAINRRELLPKGGEKEVEIRAASIWACHLLTRAINERRPPELQVVDAVVDGRLWTHYHETHWPHHLTVTTSY